MKKVHYKGKYLQLVEDDGWEYVERVNNVEAAIIIPVFVDRQYPMGNPKRDNLVLIREYRVPLKRYNYGLPAGLIGDHGQETALQAAHRELEEETGYKAGRMRHVTFGPPSSGLSNEILNFFLADKLVKFSDDVGVGGEDISVHLAPVHTAKEWLENKVGDIIDPKVYLGLYFAEKYLIEPGI